MSLKGSTTTATYLDWDILSTLLRKLDKDREYKFQLLIAVGCFTGLRISDILDRTWSELLHKTSLSLTERKTKKPRKVGINNDLQKIVANCYRNMNVKDINDHVFLNKYGEVMRVQYINRKLKQLFSKYRIHVEGGVSSHLLRKTFGRAVYRMNNETEHSLVLLSEVFNHTSIATTKRYLGLKQEEIEDAYECLSL